MQYSVLFFALSAERFATQMNDASSKLMERLRKKLRRELKSTPEHIVPIEAAARELCQGNVPPDAPQTFFDAFATLVTVFGEQIRLESFQFDTCLYLEDVGIWPWTQQESPPFPVPKTRQPLPQIGFLSSFFMQSEVLPGFSKLPPCSEGRLARNQFQEVVDSVVADNLDLVAYYSVW
jgi:hypothetical protein